MGMFSKAIKAGLLKKGFDILRKPENQRKAKQAFAKLRDSKGRRNHS